MSKDSDDQDTAIRIQLSRSRMIIPSYYSMGLIPRKVCIRLQIS